MGLHVTIHLSFLKGLQMFRFFENMIDPYVDYAETDHPPTKLFDFLWAYSQPFKRLFAMAAVMSVVVAAVEILLIFYMGRVVDLLSSGGPQAVWDAYGTEMILAALFILFIRPVLQALDVLLLNNALLPNFGTLIRYRAHRQVMRQSVGWFENDFAGRIANRVTQTPPAAGEAIFQVFDAITFALAYVVGAAVLLWGADIRLLIPMAGWLLLYTGLLRWTIQRVGPASQAAADARSKVTGRIVDSYTNIHSVKLFAHHSKEIDYAKEAIEETRQTFAKEMRIYTIMDIVLVALNGLLVVGVTGWAIWLWMQGTASTGTVAAATALTLRLNAMTGWIMWAVTTFFRSLGIVAEGMETIAQETTLVDSPGAKPLELREGRLKFDNLTHHYGRDLGGLDSIQLQIEPGQKVGLIGRSGAGKSTLVKLLLRFYDAESGRILIDGQDITDVTQDSLRGAIAMVQQESALMHRSVRENILYGRDDATEEDMIAAARQAEAHAFILDLQDQEGRRGYDAQVGERGVKLSGGQRQRIALARVILKDAPILVLDEATSALDSEVEAAIQRTLYGMMEGKTVIAIAHRLSTIAQLDRIVVLDQGRIVEDGTHSELLGRNGLYASFWNRQSGGFLATEEAAE
jgi:ATP-binding cassette subfamily B multidrug efflux pump